MGTRGFRVYRHRGRYFATYNHYDSYPEGLGADMAELVPSDPDEYKKWLEDLRRLLERALSTDKAEDAPPENNVFIEWVYEVDLDNEVFLVNNWPVFNLKSMPSRDVFADYIGGNSYGHYGYHRTTPESHRFVSWNAAAPKVPEALIDRYESRNILHKAMEAEEIVGERRSRHLEDVRIRLLEVAVGASVRSEEHGRMLSHVGRITAASQLPVDLINLGYFLIGLAINHLRRPKTHQGRDRDENLWLSSRVCLRVATHLTDKDSFRATIEEILSEVVNHPDKTGVVYGIAFSFLHCTIVRIDVDNGIIDHTPALQFLPSFYGETSSTPGITAIARLGCLLDPLTELLGIAPHKDKVPSMNFPCEIWSKIADDLFSEDNW